MRIHIPENVAGKLLELLTPRVGDPDLAELYYQIDRRIDRIFRFPHRLDGSGGQAVPEA